MYCLTDLCCLCLVNGKTIRSVILEDDDGIVVKNKLEYVLSEAKNFLSEVLKNICTACLNTLNYVYQFKRECLQNLISLNNYIERMAPVPQEYISFDQHAELQNQMRSANHFIANASENPKQKCAMNIPECTVTSHNSKYPLIPENNKEIEIVKHELQYFNDEIDIKHDPLLLDGGDSEEKSRNDFPKEPTNSEFSTNSMNSETKTKHQKTTQQYKCHVCNKGFRERCYLEKHSRSHTSVPPFECETCHKTFGTSNNLERHRHAHIGEVSDKFTLANDKPSTSEIYEEPSNHFLSAFIEDQQQMIHKNIRVAPSSQEYNADKELLEIQNPQSVCETQMKENFEEVVIKVEANVDDDMKNTEVQYESSDEEMPENTHERTSATNYNDACQVGYSEKSIPEKSKDRYENSFKHFKLWCSENICRNITEEVLLTYFAERSEKLKSAGSLWTEYSMLKTTILMNNAIDISKYKTLTVFLKKKYTGYRPRKSNVFSKEDMDKFLQEFPDEMYLNIKVAMIFGIAGACKREELYNMKIEDIQDNGSFILVHIPNFKSTISRTFKITTQGSEMINYLEIYRKYVNIKPKNSKSSKFFLSMRNGKVTNQVVGRHAIGSWPSKIAKCLNLPDPQSYTGHAFRRSSATFMAKKNLEVLF